MAFGGYTGSLTISTTGNPQATAISSSLNLQAASVPISVTSKINHVLGGDVLNGVNEEAINILTIAASGSATIDLQSLTDALGTASVVLVRLKKYVFKLLTALDDSINGTSCSSVTIGGGDSDPHTLNLGGTTPAATLYGGANGNGDAMGWATSQAAGLTVSGTACNVKVTNNDSANAAAVLYNVAGSTT